MPYLKRISPAMVVATAAVILALSGGAYAATQVANREHRDQAVDGWSRDKP